MARQALYRIFDAAGQVIYIGISDNPFRRFKEHSKGQPWVDEVADIKIVWYPDRAAVVVAEREAIKAERPRYNIVHNRHRPKAPRRRPKPSDVPIDIMVSADGLLAAQDPLVTRYKPYECSDGCCWEVHLATIPRTSWPRIHEGLRDYFARESVWVQPQESYDIAVAACQEVDESRIDLREEIIEAEPEHKRLARLGIKRIIKRRNGLSLVEYNDGKIAVYPGARTVKSEPPAVGDAVLVHTGSGYYTIGARQPV